jgi:hypothetical protein
VSRVEQELRAFRISEHKGEELRKAEENCAMRGFIICTVHRTLLKVKVGFSLYLIKYHARKACRGVEV